jgi:hypothetical protein
LPPQALSSPTMIVRVRVHFALGPSQFGKWRQTWSVITMRPALS